MIASPNRRSSGAAEQPREEVAASPSGRSRVPARKSVLRDVARRPCDRQHVVERHRNVGDHDLPGGLSEGFTGGRGRASCRLAVHLRWLRAARATRRHTQKSRMPPASSRPTIARSWMVAAAKPDSARWPHDADQDRAARLGGRPEAARPMTMASSLASTGGS